MNALVALASALALILSGAEAPSTFVLAIGGASLDDDTATVEHLMGSAFRTGVRSGANACYINSLMRHPGLQGEIKYTLRTPPGDGYYLTTVEGSDSMGDEMRECVRDVLHDFYHYAGHPGFERLEGTLHFEPRTIPAPPLPSEAKLREIVDGRYARQGVVRVVRIEWLEGPYSYTADSTEVIRRSVYRVELEFVDDAYETTCHHYEQFKVFSRSPFESRANGTSCAATAHHAGEHVSDGGTIQFRLKYYPSIAKAWEQIGD